MRMDSFFKFSRFFLPSEYSNFRIGSITIKFNGAEYGNKK